MLRSHTLETARRLALPAVLALAVSGCAGYSVRHAETYGLLEAGRPQAALDSLESRFHSGRNQVLHQLDKAMLLRMVGRYSDSNRMFESAKEQMDALDAFSITENLAAVTLNENARSYAGQPYEHLLVYAYKALNYLDLGDTGSARVEMLQADDKLREWASRDALEGIEAAVFVRYLAGLVFEINGEPGEALIAYRKAYRGLEHAGMPVPLFLQRDLLRLTAYQGLSGEHDRYRERFELEQWPDMERMRSNAEVVLIYHQGLVSPMRQETVHLYSPELNHNVVFSVPYYPPQTRPVDSLRLAVGKESAETAIIEDIGRLARERLQDRLPGITARTMARIVAKKIAANRAGDEHPLAGIVVDIAGMMSEQSDTRSWTSLPRTVQIARVLVPPGEHHIAISGYEGRRPVPEGAISLHAGRKTVISLHDPTGF